MRKWPMQTTTTTTTTTKMMLECSKMNGGKTFCMHSQMYSMKVNIPYTEDQKIDLLETSLTIFKPLCAIQLFIKGGIIYWVNQILFYPIKTGESNDGDEALNTNADNRTPDDSFDVSSTSSSDADTAVLHLYYQQLESGMIHHGTSDVSTVLVESPEEDCDEDEEIEEHIYEFLANSVFAFSLFKIDTFDSEDLVVQDETKCEICKYD